MKAHYFCDFCGEEVPANTTRCPKCGKIFTAVKCPECGYMGRAEDFNSGCPSCSYLMDKDKFKPVKKSPLFKPWIYRVALFALAAVLLFLLFLFIKM